MLNKCSLVWRVANLPVKTAWLPAVDDVMKSWTQSAKTMRNADQEMLYSRLILVSRPAVNCAGQHARLCSPSNFKAILWSARDIALGRKAKLLDVEKILLWKKSCMCFKKVWLHHTETHTKKIHIMHLLFSIHKNIPAVSKEGVQFTLEKVNEFLKWFWNSHFTSRKLARRTAAPD